MLLWCNDVRNSLGGSPYIDLFSSDFYACHDNASCLHSFIYFASRQVDIFEVVCFSKLILLFYIDKQTRYNHWFVTSRLGLHIGRLCVLILRG